MKTATKYQANQQTKESIFIDVLTQDNEILNSVKIDANMNIKNIFTKSSGLSHAEDKKIIDFAKDLNFGFFNPSKIVEVKKRTEKGIYFEINGNLHFYHKAMNSIVLCRETAPGKYWYNYGSNLNAPQEREIINFITKAKVEKLDSIYKRGFYWIADNPEGKILASGSYKEVQKQVKELKKKGLII